MSFKQIIITTAIAAVSPFLFLALVQFSIWYCTGEFHAFHLFN